MNHQMMLLTKLMAELFSKKDPCYFGLRLCTTAHSPFCSRLDTIRKWLLTGSLFQKSKCRMMMNQRWWPTKHVVLLITCWTWSLEAQSWHTTSSAAERVHLNFGQIYDVAQFQPTNCTCWFAYLLLCIQQINVHRERRISEREPSLLSLPLNWLME